MARFRLYYTPTSPFARKVRVVALERGLHDEIELVRVYPPGAANDAALMDENPLAKVPTLVTPDLGALYDSPVICEYLDGLDGARGPRLLPEGGPERLRVLRRQALCDGLLDAAILVYYERALRPADKQFEPWVAMQSQKALSGLTVLERDLLSDGDSAPLDLGTLTAVCALGWFELRKPVGDLRASHPALLAWYDRVRQRPSFEQTVPFVA